MPKDNETPISESSEDFDTKAALEDISADLFRQVGEGEDSDKGAVDEPLSESGEESQPAKEAEGASSPPLEASPDAAAPPAVDNAPEVQAVGAPETWTKEAIAEWATVPPRVQQEILKREADMHSGLAQYKEGYESAKRYDSVVEPYRAVLAAENVDPVELFRNFSGNHYMLTMGQPAQKAQLTANLIRAYGVDLNMLADVLSTGPAMPEPVAPEVQELRNELAQIKGRLTAEDTSRKDALFAQTANEVQTFAADHPYFDEVADDITLFIKAGDSLQTAYDKAVYANPVTRQKEIDRLTAEARSSVSSLEQTRADKVRKSTAADVSVTPQSRNGTVPVGSIDDTMQETLAAMKARG